MPNFLAITSRSPTIRRGIHICIGLVLANLGGCYYQKQFVREEVAFLPVPQHQDSRRLAVAPSNSGQAIQQYPDWLFDGPEGRGFANYLAQGYRQLAKQEDNQHDFRSAALFLARASKVEVGERVDPEALHQRNLPPHAVGDLMYARQRLVAVFAKDAARVYPKIAARAQVSFDCWMEQQEENLQPNDVAACHSEFEDAVLRLESALIPTVSIERPVLAAAPMPIAAASCVPCQREHVIYFELDQANLSDTGLKVVRELARYFQSRPTHGVVVSGHTDLAGSSRYNDSLSKKRVDAVVAALISAGVPSGELAATYAYGKTRPRIPTPDGERNADNRRVEVWMPCEPVDASVIVERCSSAMVKQPSAMGKERKELALPGSSSK